VAQLRADLDDFRRRIERLQHDLTLLTVGAPGDADETAA
jgi:hypothetical protein